MVVFATGFVGMDLSEQIGEVLSKNYRRKTASQLTLISTRFSVLFRHFAHLRRDICRGARVAQICNLLYRRIAFGRTPGGKSFELVAASGLQIRDTAEYNSALL